MNGQGLCGVRLLLVSMSTPATDRAVEGVHYELDLDSQYYNFEGTGFNTGDDGHGYVEIIGAGLTLPLGAVLGVSGQLGYVDSTIRSNDGYKTSDDVLSGSAEVFYRNANLGRVSLGYSRERDHYSDDYGSNSPYNYSGVQYGYSYLALAEAYVGPVTLQVRERRSIVDYGIGYTFRADYAYATARWYVVPRVRVSVDVGFKDARETYMSDVEFQPTFLRHAAGLYVGYGHSELNGGAQRFRPSRSSSLFQ